MSTATSDVDRFNEAVDWFIDRKVVTREQLDLLHVGSSEQAFWISGALQLDQVQSVFGEIEKALENGEPFEEWRDRVRGELRSDAHAETVFRNATQRAYNAGRWQQMHEPSVLKFRPFIIFDAVLDDSTTQICEFCNGVILPAESEWWGTHIPPLHHRCRSSLRNLRRSEAERLGINPTEPDTSDLRAPGEWGKVGVVWKPDKDRYDPDLGKELDGKSKDRVPPKLKEAPKRKPEPAPKKVSQRAFLDDETRKLLATAAKGEQGGVLRDWTRSALRDHLDIGGHSPNRGIEFSPAWLPSHALAATYPNPKASRYAIVGIGGDTKRGLLDLTKASKLESSAESVNAILHEEIHLATRSNPNGLGAGYNLFIEEVTTELAAQRVSYQAGVFKVPLALESRPSPFGGGSLVGFNRGISYADSVRMIVSDVQRVTGWGTQEALDKLTDAAVAMRLDSVPLYKNEHIDDFLLALDLTALQFKDLRKVLLGRKLLEL